MKFTPTTQVSGGILLHGGNTEITYIGISCLRPCRLSLVVSHPKTPILNCFYHLMWFYVSIDSESLAGCLAMLAKPYPVSGPAPMPQIPNQLHCIQKSAHEVLGTILGT